jgi:hypothetical protein
MGGLPETHLTRRADGVLLLPDDATVRSKYVLTDRTVPRAGKVIGIDEVRGLVLRRTPDGLVAIVSRVNGVYPDGWSGRRVTYTRLRCRGGSVTAAIASDEKLFSGAQTVTAAGRSVTFAPGDVGRLTVPLKPRDGMCRVTFTVSPTAVPALAEPGSTDARRLGARFVEFSYRAP